MNIQKFFSVLSLVALTILVASAPASAKNIDLMDMSEQLDKLDQADLQALLDKANGCTRARNFSCSEEQLRKAEKLANGSSDKLALNTAKQNLQTEKGRVEQEARDKAERERQIRLAEEREAEREKERQRQRRQEEEEDSPSSSQSMAQAIGNIAAEANRFNQQMAGYDKQYHELNRQAQQKKHDEQVERMHEENERRERALNERIARDEAREREERKQREYAQNKQQDQAREQQEKQRVEKIRQEEQARKQEQEQRAEKARRDDQARKEQLQKEAEAQKERQYYASPRKGLSVPRCTRENRYVGHSYEKEKALAEAERYASGINPYSKEKPVNLDNHREVSRATNCEKSIGGMADQQYHCIIRVQVEYDGPPGSTCSSHETKTGTGIAK